MIATKLVPARVTSAEVVRCFGRWQDCAATRPIVVTHHGRERLVMLSVDQYHELTSADGEPAHGDDGAARLSTVLDRMAQGFVAFDEMLRFTEINPVACAYLRTSAAAAIGRPIGDDFPDLARSLIHGHLLRALHGGEVNGFDAPSLAYPGHWLQVQTFPYGQGAACLFRNITEQVQTRRLADSTAALLTAIEAHGAIGHATLTARGTFATVDPVLAEMAGFEPERLHRVRLTDILPLPHRAAVAAAVEAVLAGDGPRVVESVLLVNRGGELPVRLALAELRSDRTGEGATLVATAR